MKKLNLILTLAALLMVGRVAAQPDSSLRYFSTNFSTGITVVNTNTTGICSNAAGYYISTRAFAEVGVQVSFKMTSADSGTISNVVFNFASSPTNSNFDTTARAPLTFNVPHNGTTTVRASTNLYLGSGGYLAGLSIINQSTNAALTNLTFTLEFKGRRSGIN